MRLFIINCSGLHLWCIISIPQLSKAETSHYIKTINSSHEIQMTVSVQSHKTSTKQIVLNCEFSCKRSINLAQHFMCSEKIEWIIIKIKYREQFRISHCFDSGICKISLLIKGHEILWLESWVRTNQIKPLLSFIKIITKEHVSKVI